MITSISNFGNFLENALGAIYYDDICPQHKIKPVSDPMVAQVLQVFQRLIQQCERKGDLKFELRVMEDDEVLKSFCLPGGKIVVTTGLLKKLKETRPLEELEEDIKDLSFEDKVAAALGHEIGHACMGHRRYFIQLKLFFFLAIKTTTFALESLIAKKENQGISKEKVLAVPTMLSEQSPAQAKPKINISLISKLCAIFSSVIHYFIVTHYHPSQELEADRYGIALANQAGYKLEGMIWLQAKFNFKASSMKKPTSEKIFNRALEIFAIHPFSKARLDTSRRIVEILKISV